MTKEPISKAAFYEVYPTGKIDMQKIEVNPDYVTAICTLYDDRTSDDTAYLVAESGVAERSEGMGLGECIALAKEMAYEGAVARVIAGVSLLPPAKKTAAAKAKAAQQEVVPTQQDKEPEQLESDDTVDTEVQQEDSPSPTDEDISIQNSTVQKLDLYAANLFPDDVEDDSKPGDEPKQPAEDDVIQKARDTKITILGKYHECNNMSAGEILDEHPEVIKEFGPVYTGPKEDQKKALMTLYQEALRRCAKAA